MPKKKAVLEAYIERDTNGTVVASMPWIVLRQSSEFYEEWTAGMFAMLHDEAKKLLPHGTRYELRWIPAGTDYSVEDRIGVVHKPEFATREEWHAFDQRDLDRAEFDDHNLIYVIGRAVVA